MLCLVARRIWCCCCVCLRESHVQSSWSIPSKTLGRQEGKKVYPEVQESQSRSPVKFMREQFNKILPVHACNRQHAHERLSHRRATLQRCSRHYCMMGKPPGLPRCQPDSRDQTVANGFRRRSRQCEVCRGARNLRHATEVQCDQRNYWSRLRNLHYHGRSDRRNKCTGAAHQAGSYRTVHQAGSSRTPGWQ